MKERESEENIDGHESFHDNLLKVEQWLMIIKQKLESFHSLQGKWNVDGRELEAEVCVCVCVWGLFHFKSRTGTPPMGHQG